MIGELKVLDYAEIVGIVLAIAFLAILLVGQFTSQGEVTGFTSWLLDASEQYRAGFAEIMSNMGIRAALSGVTGGISDMFTETNNSGETNGAGGEG